MQLQLILAAIRCHVQSLALDLAFATSADLLCCDFGGSSGPAQQCMAAKLESDAGGLMRLSLQMYNLIEARPRGDGHQDLASSLEVTAEQVAAAAVAVDDFLRRSIDDAILSPEALAFCGRTIHSLREQTQLLLNTLNVMAEELSNTLAAGPAASCAAADAGGDGGRKRGRQL